MPLIADRAQSIGIVQCMADRERRIFDHGTGDGDGTCGCVIGIEDRRGGGTGNALLGTLKIDIGGHHAHILIDLCL